MKTKSVLLEVTGRVAAFKACDLTRRLKDNGFEVSIVMTACAEKFVTPVTFETLSNRPVYRDMFLGYSTNASGSKFDMAHISLAKWADIFVIAPATANIIGKVANGIADDLLTCTAITTQAPILIAPAMNVCMWTNKIVQHNIERLKKIGVHFVNPKIGKLACGDVGQGALADTDEIIKAIRVLLK
jgi:phosphopantothenoylcysteine decarboxylase / phosphopantothenate---cysteine ligase